MKKFGLISGVMVIILIVIAVRIEYRTYPLVDTLTIDPENIAQLTISHPVYDTYSTTTNATEIESFLKHLDKVVYRKIRGNNPSYLPMEATTIYLEGNGKTDFIIIFDNKIMINHTVFEVSGGMIDPGFIQTFYETVAE